MNGKSSRTPARRMLTVALAGCLALGVAPAMAQSTGATIRGQENSRPSVNNNTCQSTRA